MLTVDNLGIKLSLPHIDQFATLRINLLLLREDSTESAKTVAKSDILCAESPMNSYFGCAIIVAISDREIPVDLLCHVQVFDKPSFWN